MASGFNTTKLITHLKSRHRSEAVWKEYEAAVVVASGAKAKTAVRSVVPIQQVFENCKNFSRDSEKAKAINDKVMEFIALDVQPFFCR